MNNSKLSSLCALPQQRAGNPQLVFIYVRIAAGIPKKFLSALYIISIISFIYQYLYLSVFFNNIKYLIIILDMLISYLFNEL